jgi:MinD-like ATPase involved in chromosome partitioning or flagellar assembly
MAAERFVVLGVANARAAWFGDVARWATAAVLPIDFVKAVSVEEVRARLRSGRPFSALLVGGGTPGLDRDLVELAGAHGCAVVAVDEGRGARQLHDLGVAATVVLPLDRDGLLDALRTAARPIERRDERALAPAAAGEGGWRGRLVAVTGSGGVGRSTLAMALATGLAADPRDRGLVVLADLALDAQQAVLHDAGDVVPGVLELVEGHRSGRLDADEVRRLTFEVPDRGYDLLLGLRRHRDWVALRRWAVAAALDGLRRTYRLVVVDVDADVEGEAESGSPEIEDRNQFARTALADADLVLVVGTPGVGGTHAQLRVVRELVAYGVEPGRLLPVVNRAPRGPRARADLTAALGRLLAAEGGGDALAATPLFVPERRRLDDLVRDGAPPPPPLVGPVTGAVRALLDRLPARSPTPAAVAAVPAPMPVTPGSLGFWSTPDEEDEP